MHGMNSSQCRIHAALHPLGEAKRSLSGLGRRHTSASRRVPKQGVPCVAEAYEILHQYTMVKCRCCEQWYCSDRVDTQETVQLVKTVDRAFRGLSY